MAYLDSEEFNSAEMAEMLDSTIQSNCLPVVKKLLNKQSHLTQDWTLSSAPTVEMAEFMLEQGLKINVLDHTGRIPLVAAINAGRLDVVKFFIDRGADKQFAQIQLGHSLLIEANQTLDFFNQNWPLNYSEEKANLLATIQYLKTWLN